MKKIVMFLAIIIVIVSSISYMYIKYQANYKIAQKENSQFDSYKDKEIYGAELTTLINKAVDNNEQNNVEKQKDGTYIENDSNSIRIDIKMLDVDDIFSMEKLYGGGMSNFVKYYNEIKFKCVQIQYHDRTKRVKHMLFEQITQ